MAMNTTQRDAAAVKHKADKLSKRLGSGKKRKKGYGTGLEWKAIRTALVILVLAVLSGCTGTAKSESSALIVVTKIGDATPEQCARGVYTEPGMSDDAVAYLSKIGKPVSDAERKPHETEIPKEAFCISGKW